MTTYSLPVKTRDTASSLLRPVLASTVVLGFKTRQFHWNVQGMQFSQLHELFGSQYAELNDAADELAERLRKLGHFAITSLKHVLDDSGLPETVDVPEAADMLRILSADHVLIAEQIHKALKACSDAGDDATADLLTTRLHAHDKAAWMLRSHLK